MDKTEKFFKFSAGQKAILDSAGAVVTGIGIAQNALEENGGWNNTVSGVINAGSNIKWLFQGASADDWLNFGISASTKVSAIAINAIASPVISAVDLVSGYDISVSGAGVQAGVTASLNGINAGLDAFVGGETWVGNQLGTALYNLAPDWFQ